MSNIETNKYEESLELTTFLSEFCKKYEMYVSIEIICSEKILTLIPISVRLISVIDSNGLIKILKKHHIFFLRYYTNFNIPDNYKYYKVGRKEFKLINLTHDNTFVKYLRKEKLKTILR
jgi:hypothetical protein